MTDQPSSLDLRLTPDWLKESEPINRYADYEGDASEDRISNRRRDRREDRPRRHNPGDRGRKDHEQRRSGAGRAPRTQATPRAGDASGAGSRSFRSEQPYLGRDEQALQQIEPAPVQVDFLPEERAFSKIIQQIKQGHTSYPLFGLARMFLERPERHRIRIRSLDNNTMLYQFGDRGPVSMDPATLERTAFNQKKDDFYETEIVEKEPVKGNFASVARCSLSGKLLGPTNYHTFQSALRSLYEQRFSRRMSFEDYRRTIEIVTNAEAVNQWKEEARKTVTYRTKAAEEPVAFENIGAVEQHFRTHYLSTVVKPCLAGEISGETGRHLPDRRLIAAIRKARDRENRFPAQIAGALRHGLNQAGLHVFKHKKRILYISTVRPQLFDPNQAPVSAGLAAVLAVLKSYPKITRKQLAEKILAKSLGEKAKDETTPEYQQAKASLVTDLIWLAKAGHVIEFADGTLDLPLPPKTPELKTKPPTEHLEQAAPVSGNHPEPPIESNAQESADLGSSEQPEMPEPEPEIPEPEPEMQVAESKAPDECAAASQPDAHPGW